ncbi:MAG: GNAT family N-acetyltransferase, partial [Eubacterium sp.]|nr:GNAT family N-acetyltransferase [Eubacterium sp.]
RNFGALTEEDCRTFIGKNMIDGPSLESEESLKEMQTRDSLHLAIADDKDEYMGTVSLKDIDRASSAAEFAITIRRIAMGRGISAGAMRDIMSTGHEKLGLRFIYWYVNKDNERAVRFYDKNGYRRSTLDELKNLGIKTDPGLEQPDSFLWYINMYSGEM